ncbi:hypothetical protein SCALM49S_02947 [Streptomyces californicus]
MTRVWRPPGSVTRDSGGAVVPGEAYAVDEETTTSPWGVRTFRVFWSKRHRTSTGVQYSGPVLFRPAYGSTTI